tara:strand:- start:197 stop:649 length:453 start_codon:yes stop_codon:yes gene_type:complete
MIAGDDRDHQQRGLTLCVFKSQSFVVRANKRERMAKLSPLVDSNGSPLHFFSFFLILRGCGSFSTLSVFFGIRMTGAIGVTFIFRSPLLVKSRFGDFYSVPITNVREKESFARFSVSVLKLMWTQYTTMIVNKLFVLIESRDKLFCAFQC